MTKSQREKYAAMVGKTVYREGGSVPAKLIGFTAGYFIARFKGAAPFIIYPGEIGKEFLFNKPDPTAESVVCPACHGECDIRCPDCDGRGVVDCDDCDNGKERCHACNRDHDCETCHGSGRRDCGNCNSVTGRVDCVLCRGTGAVQSAATEGK